MIESITGEEFEEMDKGNLIFVDVREEDEFSEVLEDTRNIPYSSFIESIEEYEWEKDVLFLCDKGNSSKSAAMLLSAYEGVGDITIFILENGYNSIK